MVLAAYVVEPLLVLTGALTVLQNPGMIPGGAPEVAAEYWEACRALPPSADFNALHPKFCERSELRRTARAAFSPLCGGMVRVFDHDCVYLGVAVGAGNHRSFVAFIACALALLVLFLRGCGES